MASSEMTAHVAALYRAIYQVVRRIPRGKVATYGQVAELAGIPGGARVAGAAMKTSLPSDRLPWQRVVGKAGPRRARIAIHDPVGAAVQRQLLADEGVDVGDTGLIALDRAGWLPSERGRAQAKTSRGSKARPGSRGSRARPGSRASRARPGSRGSKARRPSSRPR